MNPNGMLDDDLNRTIDRLLATGQPSGNPLLDDLAETVPTPNPRFALMLETQLLNSLSDKGRLKIMANSERSVIDFQVADGKLKRKPRRPPLTFAAAMIAMLLFGGAISYFATHPRFAAATVIPPPNLAGNPERTSEVQALAAHDNSLFITFTPTPLVENSEDEAAALTATNAMIQTLFHDQLTATTVIQSETQTQYYGDLTATAVVQSSTLTQYYGDLTATAVPGTNNPANGMVITATPVSMSILPSFITVTPVPFLLPYNTRLITIPMSYFAVSLEYFVVNGDQVNLLIGDEVIATNATVIQLAVINGGSELRAVSLAIHYEDVEQVVDALQSMEALQSEEKFTVELILPLDLTATPTVTASFTPLASPTPVIFEPTTTPPPLR